MQVTKASGSWNGNIFMWNKFKITFYLALKIFDFTDDILFVLTNSSTYPKVVSTYDTVTRMDLHLFAPSNLRNPHDLAVTRNGLFCFLVELNPCKIWKFKLGNFSTGHHLHYFTYLYCWPHCILKISFKF